MAAADFVSCSPTMIPAGWEICGPVDVAESGATITVRAITPPDAGSERGIVSAAPHRDRTLSFDVFVPSDACFIAKINQTSKLDQQTNSYHLYTATAEARIWRGIVA